MKNVAEIWPLAPLQELMLAHALASQDDELLVEQFHCRVSGALDPATLRRAWEMVVARHALLRAAPAWQGLKKPVQVVRNQVELPWTELDWRNLAEPEQRAQAEELLVRTRRQGFELDRPPLVCFHLVRLADAEWMFAWTCHHIVLDGWCLGILLNEAFQIYTALHHGQQPHLSPAGSFGDYLQWLKSADGTAATDFWKFHLADLPPRRRLPVEAAAEEGSTVAAGHGELLHRLSAELTKELGAFATAQRVSQSVLVQAAWSILLSRYTEQDDILFGATVSGRPPQVPHVDSIVGPFINNIPLRVRVRGEDRLEALFAQLHAQSVEVQPYEYCSSQQIAEAANLPGGRLCDTLVVYENYPLHGTERSQVGDLTLHALSGTTTSSYPLTLVALPGRELELRVLYDRRYCSPSAATRLIEQIVTLLRAMLQSPAGCVNDLSLASAADLAVCASAHEASSPGEPRALILDMARQPAPLGLPGALWVETQPMGLRATGYRAVVLADGSLEFLGPDRARNGRPAVRIGRYSVDPAEVQAILCLNPLVRDAAVLGHRDQSGTTRLAVYVVPAAEAALGVSTGHGLMLGELRRFLADRLPAPLVPAAWCAVEAIPLRCDGQPDAAQLPAPVRPRGETDQPYVAPRDPVESRLALIWSELLGVEPIGIHDGFLELGGYSSLAVALVARVEEEWGRRLPLAALFAEPTIAHLAERIRTAPAVGVNSALVPLRAGGSRAPLFCVHPAGGTVFCYLELAQHLPQDLPLYGLQAQGIDGLLAPHDSIRAMAAYYIEAMKTIQPRGPYQLCGWSTGGIIAFEIARQLQAAHEEVSLVALIDAAIPSDDSQLDESDLVPMLQMLFPGEDPEVLRGLKTRPVEEQVAFFRERAETARVLLAGAAASGARWVFDVFEANMKAAAAFRPEPLTAKLTLFRATNEATPMHAEATLGWGPWADGGLEIHTLPGSHMTMLQMPAVAELATILNQRVAEPHCVEA